MKFPVFATFLPLVLISIVISVVTVVIFAQMHHHAINEAMERSIKDNLLFVKKEAAVPMTKARDEALIMREQIITKDTQCHQAARKSFNGTWLRPTTEYVPGYMQTAVWDQLIHLNMAKGLFSYVYQHVRKANPYPTAPAGTTNPDDFPWSDCACGKTGYCDWAIDDDNQPMINFVWPDGVNFTIVAQNPFDARGFPYSDGSRSLTNQEKDKAGKWVAHEIWEDVHDGSFTAVLTYGVPVAFDTNGFCVNTVNIDVDMTWMTAFLDNLNIAASEVTIMFPDSLKVLAASYKSLTPGFKQKNASDASAGYDFWPATDSPEPKLKEAVDALRAHVGKNTFEDIPDEPVIANPKGSKHIFSARPIRDSQLNLMVLIVTEKGYYFDEGNRARNEAIIISVVLLCVMVVCTILNAVFLTSPLKVLGVRMIKTARLEDVDEEQDTSVLSEISDMQEAYYTMRSELGRLKSYLPQSVLHGNDEDDVDEEGSIDKNSSVSRKETNLTSIKDGDKNTNASSNSSGTALAAGAGLKTDQSINLKAVVVMSINLVDFHGVVKAQGASFGEVQRQYLEIVNKCVRDSKGYVDFFQGDHVVATFNAVNNIAVPSKRAALAAHNIAKALREHNTLRCSVAVGFSAGKAHVGNMGTKEMQRFNVIGTVYARAFALQQIATRQLKDGDVKDSPAASDSVRKASAVSNTASRILTTKETTVEFDCDIYWQARDMVRNLPGRVSSGSSVIISVEHMKNTKCDEWMYQLEEGASHDPFAAINKAFLLLGDGKAADAAKEAKNVHPDLPGAARLKQLLAEADP